jgi:hypothetical protein
MSVKCRKRAYSVSFVVATRGNQGPVRAASRASGEPAVKLQRLNDADAQIFYLNLYQA